MKSGLIIGLIVGLVSSLMGGMKQELPPAAKKGPAHGIHQTARYAFLFSTIVALVAAPLALIIDLPLALAFSLIASLMMLLGTGYIFIDHYALRLVLASRGYLPLRLIRFLDYAVALIFLRRVGGGYRFTHRLLMDHIAALSDADIEALTKDIG